MIETDKDRKDQPITSGFTQAGVYSRRQFCGYLEVCRPPEPLWNPRLREAAATLGASKDSALFKVLNTAMLKASTLHKI